MRAWQLTDFGLDNLRRADRPTPTIGPRDLLIRVAAAALNYRDKVVVAGKLAPDLMPRPLIPVSDAVGTVVAIGPEVSRFAKGDRVAAHAFSRWTDGEAGPNEMLHCFGGPLDGGLAEFMIIPEAAAVALFAIQFAAALGARVIATSSSDGKLDQARALGATEVINYRQTPDWHRAALDLTDGVGVDHVIELAGGAGINRSVAASRVGGHVALIGFLNGPTAEVDLVPILLRQTRIQGIAVGHRRAFERMNQFIDEHQIRPVIDSVYPFDAAIAAFEHLDRGPVGKVVIDVAG